LLTAIFAGGKPSSSKRKDEQVATNSPDRTKRSGQRRPAGTPTPKARQPVYGRPSIAAEQLAAIMATKPDLRPARHISIAPALPIWELAFMLLVAAFIGFALAVQL
jgi:hypothetical protein